MTHDTITARLSEYVDGELDEQEQLRVERHLADCEDCRAIVRDLRALASAASELPPSAPGADLWPAIATRIGGAPDHVVPFRPPGGKRRISFSLPQLAAAGILLMLLSGGVVYLALERGPSLPPSDGAIADVRTPEISAVSLVDPQFDQAIADLEEALAEGRSRLDPETVRVLEQNLEAIDTAIRQSREALEADPANSYLTRHLASARQRKLALLRRAAALTAGS